MEEVARRKRKLEQGAEEEVKKDEKEVDLASAKRSCFRCGGNGHLKIECISATNSNFTCFKCTGKGHYARDCPNLRGDICYVCGMLGHHGLDCPQNLKRKGPPSRVQIGRGMPYQLPGYGGHPMMPYPMMHHEADAFGGVGGGGGEMHWGAVGMGMLGPGIPMGGAENHMMDMRYGRFEGGGLVGCFRCGDTRHFARECNIQMGGGNLPPLPSVGLMGSPLRYPLPENCFRCGETGHFFRECKLSGDDVPSRDACFKCGRSGHFSKDCGGPDKRVCFVCHRLGHVAKQCELPTPDVSDKGAPSAPKVVDNRPTELGGTQPQ